jgi:hypothetical protein
MDTEGSSSIVVPTPLTIEAPKVVSSPVEPAPVEMTTEPVVAPAADAPAAVLLEAKKIGSGNPFSSATTPVSKPAANMFSTGAVVSISLMIVY